MKELTFTCAQLMDLGCCSMVWDYFDNEFIPEKATDLFDKVMRKADYMALAYALCFIMTLGQRKRWLMKMTGETMVAEIDNIRNTCVTLATATPHIHLRQGRDIILDEWAKGLTTMRCRE